MDQALNELGDPPRPPDGEPLTGGVAVWIFMTVEVVTFGMFLIWHAASWSGDPVAYAAAQAQLSLNSATIGTALLLTGSLFVALGAQANAAGSRRATAAWLLAGSLTGVIFTVNKLMEWAPHLNDGVTLSTNGFWFTYLFLTQLHLLHVLPGVGLLAVVAWRAWRGDYGPENPLTVEGSAAYWHLVDVIWLLLFAVLYGMRP